MDKNTEDENHQDNDELNEKYEMKQIQYIVQDLNNRIKESVEKIDNASKQLKIEIEKLQKEGLVLCKLPETIAIHMTEMLPEISKQLMENIFHDLDKTTQSIYKNIQIAEARLIQSSKNVETNLVKFCEQAKIQLNDAVSTSLNFDNFLFKKILLNVLIVVVFSMASASGVSYLMIKKFPQRVEIKTDKAVTVHDSDVSFWGSHQQIINKNGK